ncbi:vacuolar protein sorting-associated protein 51 homolog isoform X2 [Gossypium hirsutum]|uniref:Vacuolar protein sorting-associated protein 51 homolog n=1 Tax=Gossypium hirsutum TaxID=3635 RepID=A0ABM2Z4R2_GOSHI|nr:vacuolar protein sorting-associated protein 51 homolog isoform X2 [Gossypium hirsutum]
MLERAKMATDDIPLDDKAKRMRDLLSSFYYPYHGSSPKAHSNYENLDSINSASFNPEHYMNLLVQKSNLEELLRKHVEMAAEIKNLDTDLQMLVYENYNKFISATDAIKWMKSNIVGMEANMEQLLDKIMSVQSRSDRVNTSLFEKREHIEKLHRTRNLLRKVQGKLFSDSESIQARAEAAVLLKQLDFPVDSLQAKLLEKLEQSLGDLQLKTNEIENVLRESNDPSKQGKGFDSVPGIGHEVSVHGFAEAIRAYRVIFPDSESQLIKLAQNLVIKHFEMTEQRVKRRISSTNFLGALRAIWDDVLLMDGVLSEAALSNFSLEVAHATVKKYVASTFTYLLQDISDALLKVKVSPKEAAEEHPLQAALEASKKTVLQGSMDVLLDFRQLLDEKLGLLVKLRAFIIDWVQEGFQDFFRSLDGCFLLLSGRKNSSSQDQGFSEGALGEKVLAGLVLVLAQLSVFIEQTAIPRISEEIAASFSSGGARGHEHGHVFISGEICQLFQLGGEKLLHHYINIRTRRVSTLLRKRFTTPNWVKHKEPREVHMFVDLFLQELKAVGSEVKQILPEGLLRKHQRSDSNGSTNSSRSNALLDDKMSRSNTQKARSQLLETHLAKLFKQKIEIFTKVEYTQESVETTIVKLCLKSLQEYVRLQTFNRSGFQQIQLDIHFLRTLLKENIEAEEAIDFLLDEVIVAASERCLDPIPLEPPILDKLVQVKLSKSKEHNLVKPLDVGR